MQRDVAPPPSYLRAQYRRPRYSIATLVAVVALLVVAEWMVRR